MKNYYQFITNVPDFPKKGINFKDITPLMANGKAFAECCHLFAKFAKQVGAELIVGPEARGFVFGTPTAMMLEVGFVPVRKKGKLPRAIEEVSYDLEYDQQVLAIHNDAIKKGQKVVIIDDLLATGGTIKATIDLVEKLKGEVVGVAFLIELSELKGREKLHNYNVFSLLKY